MNTSGDDRMRGFSAAYTGIPVEKHLPAVYIGAGIRAKNKPKNNRFGKEKRK